MAQLQYRSSTDFLSTNSQAFDFQYQTFSKSASFDNEGKELVSASNDHFTVKSITLKYSKSFYPKIETALAAKFQNLKSELNEKSLSKSGFESVSLLGKYLFINKKFLKMAAGVHLKKATFSNVRYEETTPPPTDELVLGDDGLEYGIDYLTTYNDKYFKYDLKLGYNKPSSNLSSELLYNLETIYSFTKTFLIAGIGGIYSLKNDPYSETPSLKPQISRQNSYLFNSTNREKTYLYAGIEHAFSNFIMGFKAENTFTGKSTDKGSTIALNLRWEKNIPPPQIKNLSPDETLSSEYFAQGFVAALSKSKKFAKINIGFDHRIKLGTFINIYNIHNYTRKIPAARGQVIKVDSYWSIVKLSPKKDPTPIQVGDLVQAYSNDSDR